MTVNRVALQAAAAALTAGYVLFPDASGLITENANLKYLNSLLSIVDKVQITNSTIGDGLFIDQNGNGVALHIDNDGSANSLTIEGTTANDLVVLKSGNVGIGTASPGAKLDVVHSETDAINVILTASTPGGIAPKGLKVAVSGSDDHNYGVYSSVDTSGAGGTAYGFYGVFPGVGTGTDYGVYMTGENKNYFSGNVGIGEAAPASSLVINGGVNIGGNEAIADNNLYVTGNCSALTFTDRTPHYEGDALSELRTVKGKDGKIDHSTLPTFAQKQDVDGTPTRNLGAMISILVKAVQQLTDKIEKLEIELKKPL